jgi:hypothetical protein
MRLISTITGAARRGGVPGSVVYSEGTAYR